MVVRQRGQRLLVGIEFIEELDRRATSTACVPHAALLVVLRTSAAPALAGRPQTQAAQRVVQLGLLFSAAFARGFLHRFPTTQEGLQFLLCPTQFLQQLVVRFRLVILQLLQDQVRRPAGVVEIRGLPIGSITRLFWPIGASFVWQSSTLRRTGTRSPSSIARLAVLLLRGLLRWLTFLAVF